jgi:hypothetical protein
VHDRHTSGSETGTIRPEDLLHLELLEDTMVDRPFLDEVFDEPRKYLQPPRLRRKHKPAQSPGEPESPLARRAKLAGLVVAAALLIASIVAAATLTDEQDEASGTAPEKPEITGIAALGGFVIPPGTSSAERPATEPATGPVAANTTVTTTPEPFTTTGTSTGSGSTSRVGQPTTTTSTTRVTTTTTDNVGRVEEFYRLVDNNPEDAAALLAPSGFGSRTDDLVRAWKAMRSVQLESVQEEADGSIRAVVVMVQPDGKELRVTHLLTMSQDAATRIAQAELVSAEPM